MQQQRGTGIKRGAVDKITRAFSPSGAVSNGWFSTADRIAASVIKFDRAAGASHSPTPHRLDRNRANRERFMPCGLRILYHGALSIR
jgi:hypothetical protein